jgi:hypothetical protein
VTGSAELHLPPGYRLDRSDPDLWTLRRPAHLKYADRDAKRFVETVMGTQDSDNTEEYLLHDEQENEDFRPTRGNILYFLSLGGDRDKSTELDFLFFYFSGHGWSSQDGTDYLLTSDSLVKMPDITAIPVPLLEGYLRNWEAKHVVLFIDACRTVRTGGKSTTIPEESMIDVKSLSIRGMVTFCSCEPGKTSFEADPIHSGVFTEGVCRALSDEGRCSTIQELDKYLNDKVPRISRTYGLPRQIPYTRVQPLGVEREIIVSQRTWKEWQIQKRRTRLNRLYAQAHKLSQDRKWQAVVDVFAQIHSEDPVYPDEDRLLASARETLEDQQRAQRVVDLYNRGWQHMHTEEWSQALKCFEQVQRLHPGYRETEGLLAQVRHELDVEQQSTRTADISARNVKAPTIEVSPDAHTHTKGSEPRKPTLAAPSSRLSVSDSYRMAVVEAWKRAGRTKPRPLSSGLWLLIGTD